MDRRERYVKDVLSHMSVDRKMKMRIHEDLMELVIDRCHKDEMDPVDYLGSPAEMAKDFMEGMGSQYNIREKREYKSDAQIFGIPIVHINYEQNGVAKGIFAVGGVSIGVFSFGGLSLGIFGFGGLSLTLLTSIGGISVSGGMAIGGLAVGGIIAAGGAAISSMLAMGGLAIGKLAIGDVTRGLINIYQSSGTGQYLFRLPLENTESVLAVIREEFPRMPEFIFEGFKYWMQ